MHAYASVRTTCLVCVSLLIVRPGFGGYREIFVSSDWGWDASPCVGDADNDGLNELVATAYDHVAVYSWDGESFVLDADWHLDGVQAAFGPAVGDADNDSTNEVLVGTWAHSVLSFQHTEGSYLPEETFPWSDYGNWSIAIRDLHDTPGNEVLVSGRYGNFYAFHKGDSGYKLYYTSPELGSGDNVRVLILGIGDTDGNGVSDVITYCQQGALDAFEVDGSGFKHTWHMQFDNGDNPDDQCGAGTVKDVDDDGTAEVFYADAYGNVVGLRHDGADYVEFWRRSLDWVPFSLAVGDVDRDDAAEVIVGKAN
jgi:hypothetical protein